ncbi:hypothetical protein H5410_031928, partial [Solanum commersonii]
WEEVEVPETCEEVERAEVPDDQEVGVIEDASAGNESTSTSREVSVGASLLLSASSRRHNSMIRIGNGRKVFICLALMAISFEIRSPRSMLLHDMMDPRHAALAGRIIDWFWDGIRVLLMKQNE